MTKLMEKAIEAMRRLSEDEQDALAREVLARLAEEAEWEHLVSSPESKVWLEKAAGAALEADAKGDSHPFDPSDRPK